MTPKQMNAVMARMKRALEEPAPAPPAKRQRRRRVRKASAIQGPISNTSQVLSNPIVPRSMVTSMQRDKHVVISDTELWIDSTTIIGSATTPFAASYGTYVEPKKIGSWLANIAQNYSRYRIRKLSFTYQPAVGTTTRGFIGMGFFTDPQDAAAYAANSVSTAFPRLSACTKFTTCPLYGTASITLDRGDFNGDWLSYEPSAVVTEENARLVCAGGIGFYISYDSAAPAGNIFVTYEVELANPVNANLQF